MPAWNSTLKPSRKQMQRGKWKPSSKTKRATASERKHMSALAQQGCCLCRFLGLGETPAEIHHIRHGMGAGQRNGNTMTIPLCPEHHRGNTGYHGMGRRAFEAAYGVTELDLLAMCQQQTKTSPAPAATGLGHTQRMEVAE